MYKYLYRGVNEDLHKKLGGELHPKMVEPFARMPSWDKSSWDNSTWDASETNGVIEHQIQQAGHPTSGVSTTPHYERALVYATNNGKYVKGYIYVVDTDLLGKYNVTHYIVNEHVVMPAIPEDDEVILVASDFSKIPSEVIIEITEINA